MEELLSKFREEIESAKNSETIEEANVHLVAARGYIERVKEVIPKMQQETHDLTQDLYNRLKPEECNYVGTIKYKKE